MNKKYKIYPMPAGINADPMDKSLLLHRYPIGTPMPLYNGSFAVSDGEEWILVDAGTASNKDIVSFGKPPIQNEILYEDSLKKLGIIPEQVTKVVLTHLHWDHAWNLKLFPNAKFYVQEKEIYQSVVPYTHEHTQYGYMGIQGYENPPFLQHIHQMVPVRGEYELCPGILLVPTPGHTHGSQSVLVDTEEGRYAITGDFCFLRENWEKGIMIGNPCSCSEWYESYERLKSKHVDQVLTSHDAYSYAKEFFG